MSRAAILRLGSSAPGAVIINGIGFSQCGSAWRQPRRPRISASVIVVATSR